MDRVKLQTIGWREWMALPDLGVPAIKAKIDTGARSSALHAASLTIYRERGAEWVRFVLHPVRKRPDIEITGEAPILDRRQVSDSGGNKGERIFIETRLAIEHQSWPIELNLTDRETMLFPMLLGRTAMKKRLLVDPTHSYLLGRPSKHLTKEYPPAGRQRSHS